MGERKGLMRTTQYEKVYSPVDRVGNSSRTAGPVGGGGYTFQVSSVMIPGAVYNTTGIRVFLILLNADRPS